jgi:hypothetical protein
VFPCRELFVHPTAGVGLQNPQQVGHRTCTSREANLCGIFFRPYPGLLETPCRSPRLAPWATVSRPSGFPLL